MKRKAISLKNIIISIMLLISLCSVLGTTTVKAAQTVTWLLQWSQVTTYLPSMTIDGHSFYDRSNAHMPLTYDVTGDGIQDVFITHGYPATTGYGSYGLYDQGSVWCFNGANGSIIWSRAYQGVGDHAVMSLHDLDGDGDMELLVCGYHNTTTYHAENGQILWEEQDGKDSAYYRHDKPAVVLKLNGQTWVYTCKNSGGSTASTAGIVKRNPLTGVPVAWSTAAIEHPCYGGLSAADINDDGQIEILLGDRSTGQGLSCYNATTLVQLWNFAGSIACSTQAPQIIPDQNGNGGLDIVVANQNSKTICIVDGKTHALLASFGSVPSVDGDCYDSAIYDIDKDGHLEYIAAASTSYMKVYDLVTHNLDVTINNPHNTQIYGYPPIICNAYGNSDMEFINQAQWYNGGMDIFDSNFTWVAFAPLGVHNSNTGEDTVVDMDNDGYNELIQFCYDDNTGHNDKVQVFHMGTGPVSSPKATAKDQYYTYKRNLVDDYVPYNDPDNNGTTDTIFVATNGSDTTGTGTISSPYRTIQKGVNMAVAGDTVYVRGGNYNEYVRISASGTYGNPITLTSYNNERAVIDGTGVTLPDPWSALVMFYNSPGTVFAKNITIQNIAIENSTIHGIRTLNDQSNPSSNIKIDHCTFRNIHSCAICFWQDSVSTHGRMSNMTVSNCTFWKVQAGLTSGEGLSFVGIRNLLIEHNTVLWARTIGIAISGGCTQVKIRNNNLHVNESELTAGSISAIYIEPDDHNYPYTVSWVNISNNVIWGTVIPGHSAYGIALAGEIGIGYNHNITMYNNVINLTCDAGQCCSGIQFFDDNEAQTEFVHYNDITMMYNTIYCRNGVDSHPISLRCNVQTSHHIVIANNILLSAYSSTNYQLYCYNTYNTYFNSTDPGLIRANNLYYNTVTYTSDVRFRDGTGSSKFEATAIRANPEVVSFALWDFHLNVSSPAINSASSLYTVPFDIEGNPRPYGVGYDIGAYEYVNGGDDTAPPEISDVTIIHSAMLDTVIGWENISCTATDNIAVHEVLLYLTDPGSTTIHLTMQHISGTSKYYYNTTLIQSGNYSYQIWADDTSNNNVSSTATKLSLPPNWDINDDGKCNVLDLTQVSNHYGQNGANGWIRQDVDNNGHIQVADLVLVSNHYSESWWV